MGYAWQENANSEGSQAAKLPKGQHRVRICKIVFGDRQGNAFRSKAGDPQIMVVFQDREAREAGHMYTLSEKAGFTLAKLLSACDPPVNLARMEEAGIEPAHFADQAFAETNLLNREVTIDVDWEKGQDGKEHSRCTPIQRRGAASVATPPASSDAPPSLDSAPAAPAAGRHYRTKDDAWRHVVESWRHMTDAQAFGPAAQADYKQRRNDAWMAEIKRVGKPEHDFTPEDWHRCATAVASAAPRSTAAAPIAADHIPF